MEGSVLLHRCLLDSQVFAHQTALKIWIWCLCKASYKDRFVPLKIGKGEITIKLLPGQFIFGRFKAEEELGIDGSSIYRWMQKFESEEFGSMINIESNNQYSIITICKWGDYQVSPIKKRTTNEQPMSSQRTADEQQLNTYNKDNTDNKVIYNEFYDSEILKSNNNEDYKSVVKALFGENELCCPLKSVLKMETQLYYAQFQKLWKLKQQYNFSIIDYLEKMENWGNPAKRKTVYKTFLTFVKNDFKGMKV